MGDIDYQPGVLTKNTSYLVGNRGGPFSRRLVLAGLDRNPSCTFVRVWTMGSQGRLAFDQLALDDIDLPAQARTRSVGRGS